MSNATDPVARQIHGTNPQFLIEKIVRVKAYETLYWKEECFALTAKTLIDKAIKIRYVGGSVGATRAPTPFICLILKMLQIQPDMDVIYEYISNESFKYLRLLGAFYLRLTGRPADIYRRLEPLLSDYRKIVIKDVNGLATITHVDEIIEKMLYDPILFGIALPRLAKRPYLLSLGLLQPYASELGDTAEILDEWRAAEAARAAAAAEAERALSLAVAEDDARRHRHRDSRTRSRSPSRPRSWSRSRSRSRSPRPWRDRDRSPRYSAHSRSRSPARGSSPGAHHRSRSRSRSPVYRHRYRHSRSRSRDRSRSRSPHGGHRHSRHRRHSRDRSQDRAAARHRHYRDQDARSRSRSPGRAGSPGPGPRKRPLRRSRSRSGPRDRQRPRRSLHSRSRSRSASPHGHGHGHGHAVNDSPVRPRSPGSRSPSRDRRYRSPGKSVQTVVPPADRFRARWLAHFPPEAAAAAAAAFDDLVARYAEPHRAYHTFVHIATCLGLLDTVAAQLRDPRAVELALWFHDVIYDTHAKDNEARSADYARDVLSRLGAAPALVDRVAQLVQLTAHPSVPRDGDEEALLDIDLSTLGADADAYAEYAAAIRREYQWVPEDVFRRERGRLLEGFLAQRLFHSRHFGALLEERARRNLEWEIAQLRQ